jgi:23S rRNA (cytidine2498-2'-O)-methyltransferase
VSSEPPEAHFWYALAAPECLNLVKKEVALRYPNLRLAYSRQGLLTFKGAVVGDFAPRLALHSGESFGQLAWSGAVDTSTARRLESGYRVRVWQPSLATGPFAPLDAEGEELRSRVLDRLDALGVRAEGGPGRKWLDVFLAPEGASAAPMWWGLRQEARGGQSLLAPELPPPEAPSRAYSKLREVVRHWALVPGEEEAALELGAAPGGASLALLELGLHLMAVDPGEMDARLPDFASQRQRRYQHVAKKASALDRSDLGGSRARVTWLVSDINLAPPVALTQLAHALSLVKKTVQVVIVTFKINDERALASVDTQLERLASLTGGTPVCAHLPSHRREFAAVVELKRSL